ncbi:putative ABC transporter [Klebsiella pneumoniae]|uniref:Putative ABC transporter n=1 Tax=Klebsiella pneumoniae TaxID=573 RepID=A0A2X3BKN9_KLEPN|nr:putative ABC transporter [Klebsiella pneumoniae]
MPPFYWVGASRVAEGEMTAGWMAAFYLLLGAILRTSSAVIRDCRRLAAGDGQR